MPFIAIPHFTVLCFSELYRYMFVTNFFNNTYGKKMKFFELSKNNVSKKNYSIKGLNCLP